VGQGASDEIGAMLQVNRARNWAEFRAALESFAVPGQNMLYADVEGNIGKAIAARLPRRPAQTQPELIRPTAQSVAWQSFAAGGELPAEYNPQCGYVASANDRPPGSRIAIGFLFSPPDRRDRLAQLLNRRGLKLSDFIALQSDVLSTPALAFRDQLLRFLREVRRSAKLGAPAEGLIRELSAWDGRYGADSRGALAFELLVFRLAERLAGRKLTGLYGASWNPIGLVRSDFESQPPVRAQFLLRTALRPAARDFADRDSWGAIHRLRPQHLLGVVPAARRLLRVPDWPAAGSRETVFKAAHGLTNKRHYVRLAANARHISHLSDLDRNYFVLLGGQDGWIGSTTSTDQVPFWRSRRYIQLPMRPETVAEKFPFHTELRP
jgi:penicillin amidase